VSRPAATPDELLRTLADPGRLAVAGLIAVAPRTVADLAGVLDERPDRVRRHLSRLTAAGIVRVDADRRTYRLDASGLREAAREVGPPREPGVALGALDEDEEAVLRQYFRGGRLREIPARRSKRLVVLERLAQEFEVGIRYPEAEVRTILERFHPDHAALRRYLVDEGFLGRERGVYWRTGGRVDI
jgi:hypothetical protein